MKMKRSRLRRWLALVFLASALGEYCYAELVAHWPLREIDGSTFADLVGDNHGVVPADASVSFALDAPDGVANNSVVFTGDDGPSFIETPFIGIGGADARTIAAWVKTTPETRATAIVAYGSLETARKWHFRVEGAGGGTRIRTEFQGGQIFGGDTNLGDNEWHHIVSVFPEGAFAGEEVIHYVDGEIEENLGGNGAIDIDTGAGEDDDAFPVHIGLAIGHAGRWFDGQIADVRIYDEELSASDIREIMDSPSMLPPGDVGDFNGDGTVDNADFTVLASNFNSTFLLTESYSKGDFDLNARVNMADFWAFRAVLNAPAGAAAVPEPSTAWLALLGLAAMSFLRRFRSA